MPAAGMLGGDEAKPCCKLSSVLELAGVADAGDHGVGRERTHADDSAQAEATIILARMAIDASVARRHGCTQLHPVLSQRAQQFLELARRADRAIDCRSQRGSAL